MVWVSMCQKTGAGCFHSGPISSEQLWGGQVAERLSVGTGVEPGGDLSGQQFLPPTHLSPGWSSDGHLAQTSHPSEGICSGPRARQVNKLMLVRLLHLRVDAAEARSIILNSLPCRFISGEVRMLGCRP